MQSQYTINGKVYRLVEEEKKPERLEGWIVGKNYERNPTSILSKKKEVPQDDTRMVEIREGEVIVSRDTATRAWNSCNNLESFMKELGI
jgi:hypothetical protein